MTLHGGRQCAGQGSVRGRAVCGACQCAGHDSVRGRAEREACEGSAWGMAGRMAGCMAWQCAGHVGAERGAGQCHTNRLEVGFCLKYCKLLMLSHSPNSA